MKKRLKDECSNQHDPANCTGNEADQRIVVTGPDPGPDLGGKSNNVYEIQITEGTDGL